MPRLMIVDDEPLIRHGLIKMIARVAPEWEVALEADDGTEAIRTIAEARVDLVIADIRMPKMDGLQLIKLLSGSGYAVPVVFLTGYGDFYYAREALRFDAFDYLLKPIQEHQIRQVLNRFMREKFIPVGESIDNMAQSQIGQFEFDLTNALESRDKQRVSCVLARQGQLVSPQLPAAMILNHAIRIINTFFTKKGIFGLDYVPKAVPEQLAQQLETIAQQACDLLDRIGGGSSQGGDRLIEKAQTYIRQHIGRPLTLATVADYVHFNPTYFSEYFRLKTGETFSHYLIRTRIEEAMQRLRNPACKINELAEQLGYQDARYFSKMFKLIVGMTPKEYKASVLDEP